MAESPRDARARFVLEDYRATQQSLSRLDASIVSTRNWMVVTVIAYYGLVGRLMGATGSGPVHVGLNTHLLWPPLALWALSYVFTTYERGNSKAIQEVIVLIERAHLAGNEGEYGDFLEVYTPSRTRLNRLNTWQRLLWVYPPALSDKPVWIWHLLLLAFILLSGWAMYPRVFCPGQCSLQYCAAFGSLAVATLLSYLTRSACERRAQGLMLRGVECLQRDRAQAKRP